MPRDWLRSLNEKLSLRKVRKQPRQRRSPVATVDALETRTLLAAPSLTGSTTFNLGENIGVNSYVNTTNAADPTTWAGDNFTDAITGYSVANTSNNQFVALLSATPNDGGQAILSIASPPNTINSTTPFRVVSFVDGGGTVRGAVVVNNFEAINFETTTSFSVAVRIIDTGPNAADPADNETADTTVTINLLDRNDIPYITLLPDGAGGVNASRDYQQFSVNENSVAGTVLNGNSGINAGGLVDAYSAVQHGSSNPVDNVTPSDPLVSNRSDTIGQIDSITFDGTKDTTLRYEIAELSTATTTQGTAGNNEVQRIFKPFNLVAGQYVLYFSSDIPMQTVVQGNPGTFTSEVQQIDFGNPPASGFYTLTFRDQANPQTTQTTRHLSYLATAAEVQAELQSLTNLGANNVRVDSLVTTVQTTKGGVGVNEVQTLSLTSVPKSGFFRLTFNGQRTAGIAAGADGATVQAALEALSTIGAGNVNVTGGAGGPYTVTFVGNLAQQDVTAIGNVGGYTITFQGSLTATNQDQLIMTSFTGALSNPGSAAGIQAALRALPTVNGTNLAVAESVSVATLQTGGGGLNEIQQVTLNNLANTNSFRLNYRDGNGNFSTVSLSSLATPAQVQNALQALPNIGTGNVSVSSGGLGVYNVTFTGALANTNVQQMTSTEGWHITFQNTLGNLNVDQVGVVNASDLFAISNDVPTLGRLTVSPTADPFFMGTRFDGQNGLRSGFEFFRDFFGTTIDQIPLLINVFDRSAVDPLFNTNVDPFPRSNLSYSEYVLVQMLDESEAAPLVQDEAYTISEASPNGTVVGRINDINNVSVALTTPPGVASNEVQTVTAITTPPFPAGTFQLTFNGQTTSRLSYNATAQEVENALRALNTIGGTNVAVTRTQLVNSTSWQVTFQNALGATDVPLLGVLNGVSDPESPPQVFSYLIVGGNTGNAFAVNPTTGEITVNNSAALDFETQPNYRLLVRVTDTGNPSLNTITAVDITLTDFNEATNILANQQFNVEEGSPVGTQIGAVSVSDLDGPNATLKFQITNGNTIDGNGNPTFAINQTTGVITVNSNALLDSATNPFFDLEIRVTDDHIPINSTDIEIIRINVIDVNQSPPILNDISFTIDENRPNGFLVGTLQAINTEPNQSVTYSTILGDPAFSINAATGEIRITAAGASGANAVNFENRTRYDLVIQASDSGNPALFDLATITIFVNNLNEPVDLKDQNFTIAENSTGGTLVGTALIGTDPRNPLNSTTDDDGLAQGYAYSIVSGNTNGAFTIDIPTGQISVANPLALDYETVPNRAFFLVVQVQDTGTPTTSSTGIVRIDLSDANDAPVLNNQTLPPLLEHRVAGTVVGTVTVSDQDNNDGLPPQQTFQFAIIGGNIGNAFAINATTGQVTVNNPGAVDFAQNPSFNLTVQVTDVGNPTPNLIDTGIVTINLIDQDPPIINDQTLNLNENSSNGTIVGSLNRTGGTAPFSFVIDPATNPSNTFSVNAAGELVVNSSSLLNFETNPSFTLLITVTDSSAPQFADNALITVNLIDVNERPVFSPAVYNFGVTENSAFGTNVGTVTATDPDIGQTLTYSIVSGNPFGVFEINGTTGQITVGNAVIDFEATPQFTLEIAVTDNGVPPQSSIPNAIVTIDVANVNERPDIALGQLFTIDENPAVGFPVGTVLASDPDAGQSLTYSITGGNIGGAFAINASTGAITVANPIPIDFEVNPVFNLTVQVTDNGVPALNDSETVTILLNNISDPPVVNDQTFTIPENSAAGTPVGTVLASDQDPGQTLTFAITAGNGAGTFAINASTGAITVASPAALNFETTPSIQITVTVTDNGVPALSDTAIITINLTDVNDAPVVNNQTFLVAESSPNGTTIGTVLASDEDLGQSLTYAFTAGNGAGIFAINASTGAITVANASLLDFETTPSYTLTVQVTDSANPSLSDTATITIDVTNTNEPPVVNDQTFTVPENSVATTPVGTVVASDPDLGQTRTFSITAGNTGGAFAINANTGAITVANPAVLNFEVTPTFSLTVQVTDNGVPSLSDTATVTINLTDVNEAPVVNDQTFSIAENTAGNTLVGTVISSDPDNGQTRTYAITAGNTGAAFSIDANTGELRVANPAALNFETTPVFNLTVQVTDNGVPVLSDTANVRVNLSNVNDPPDINNQNFNVLENSANGTIVGNVVATNEDAGQSLTYSILAGNTSGAFVINPATGRITVANSAALDFETNPVFNLTVQVTDNGNPSLSDTATITIFVDNANDAPVVPAQVFNITENRPVGTIVGTVAFNDPDPGQSWTFAIVSGNTGGAFALDAATGRITVNNAALMNFETNPQFILQVRVTDNGTPSLSGVGTVTINLIDANDAPVIQPNAFTVPENSPVGTVLGVMTAIDPDANALPPVFTIVGGNVNNAFAINSVTGLVTVANPAALEFERAAVFLVTIRAADGANSSLFTQTQVRVDVTNVNEPPVVPNQTFTVPENSALGTLVGQVAFNEQDAGQQHTFQIDSGNINGAFTINATTGQITVANPSALNFEVRPQFVLQVRVTDNGVPTALSGVGTVTINLTNVNEAPTIVPSTFSVPENSPVNTFVGQVLASDPDGGSPRYSIVGGNVQNTFAINVNTGQITVANPAGLEFERADTFILTVRASDAANANLFSETGITVRVTNVNEAPTVPTQNMTVPEGSPANTVVGQVTFVEQDAGQQHTFSIVSGNTGGAFAINATTGVITVVSPALLDFESTPLFTLQVRVTDNGTPQLSGTGTVRITLTNVNEAPTISPQTFTIAENAANGSIVGNVQAVDPDGGSPLIYSIVSSSPSAAFGINANTGQLTVVNSALLNFETSPQFQVTVRITDSGNAALTAQAVMTINLTNINEPPVVNNATFAIAEGAANGSFVGQVTFTNPEPNQSVTFSVQSGNTGGAFAIDAATGRITVANRTVLDFETIPTFTLQVRATDNGSPSASSLATITINLLNANEAPVLNDQSFSLAENSSTGSVVGLLAWSDNDPGTNPTFSIISGNELGGFSIDASTGRIRVANPAALNFEANPTFRLNVRLADNGAPSLSDTALVTINLANVNEAPVMNDQTFNLRTGSAAGATVGTVVATDPDIGQRKTFTITGGNTGSAFQIDATTGRITVKTASAVRTAKTFRLSMRVVDNGSPSQSDTAVITINVTNSAREASAETSSSASLDTTPSADKKKGLFE